VDEQGVYEVVVGVPKTLDGEVAFQARKVLSSLVALRREFPGVRFVEWDERFTTRLAGSHGRRKGTTVRVDHLAAARMLQEYLGTRESH
jgi:putative holliday junction resolvase